MEPLPQGFRWPDGIRAAAMFTFDVDAEAVMLTDHPEVVDYLDVIGHQRYGPKVAVPRLLRMLDRRRLRTTFFIPGWVAEAWPDVARSIRDAGHEIGHHGYLHESVRGTDEATEEGYLLRGFAALDAVLGIRPVGYRAPSCDMNFRTPDLLARHGFRYSSGMMDSDHPYRHASGVIELPMHWSLDDWNRYNYVPGYASSPILSPSAAVGAWAEELEGIVEVGGLFDLTMHPFISGRPARAAALEGLIERAQSMDGVWVAAADEIAAWVETLDLPPVSHARPTVD
ncbi:MAG TPA: polysaccharide deacetylase [Candidatus Limnocylindrales bacterium]|nr:polysaccharide deacetylase [Candidatus Limnocylindrales bacterium]